MFVWIRGFEFCPLSELLEEADVVLVVVANIVDALQDHRDALNAHAECVAGVDFGIDADCLEDFRIDHATAHDFEPLVAELAEIGREEVHFEAWLGEWEEARP